MELTSAAPPTAPKKTTLAFLARWISSLKKDKCTALAEDLSRWPGPIEDAITVLLQGDPFSDPFSDDDDDDVVEVPTPPAPLPNPVTPWGKGSGCLCASHVSDGLGQ